jgi:hypothetical protein
MNVCGLYGNFFFDLFQSRWPEFWPHRGPGRNQEIYFRNWLRKNQHVDAADSSVQTNHTYTTPTGDTQFIDYVLVPSNLCGTTPRTSDLLATCEMKGPARKTLWDGERNWYDRNNHTYGLLPDVRKQSERACALPDKEHYCAWIVTLNDMGSGKVRRELDTSLDALSRMVKRDLRLHHRAIATFKTCHFEGLRPGRDEVMFLWRILPPSRA